MLRILTKNFLRALPEKANLPVDYKNDEEICFPVEIDNKQGGSNMTWTDLCVNKPHCAAAVRP
jgi:hypothetical protein